MYRIPKELDLSPIQGEFTTQIRVGQFDIQFTFGDVDFMICSPIDLFRGNQVIAHWEEGSWPDAGFHEIMNVEIIRCEVVNNRLIIIEFANNIQMHLVDNSDQYETMHIRIKGDPSPWIV